MDKEIKNIEDLFSIKLESAEIEPGRDLTRRVMHKLGVREFMRFNLRRLNIWYIGTVAVAAGAVILITSTGDSHKASQGTKHPEMVIPYDTTSLTGNDSMVSDRVDILIPPPVRSDVRPGVTRVKPRHGVMEETHESPVTTPGGDSGGRTVIPSAGSGSLSTKALLIAKIGASATEGCVPMHIMFENTAAPGASCKWTFGDGGTSDEANPEWIFDEAGTYRVTLTVTADGGHSAFSSLTINVWPKPEAAFDILPADPALPGDEITFINNSSGASSFIWHFGDGATSTLGATAHKYTRYGKYNVSLVAISDFGCRDSLAITDAFSDTDCYIRFPNAFTPNRGGPTGGYYNRLTDNTNMVFHPVCSGVIRYNLKIYSKQGYIVYESDDINMGWDGYYKGQLCSSGVYIWKAEGKFRNGEEYVMSGDVTLVNY